MENKKNRIIRREKRVRSRFPQEGYRLAVSRSNRYLFAQVIDQKTGKTVLGLADRKLLSLKEMEGKTKSERAKLFGEKLSQEVLKKKIDKVVFDRGACRYHGRIKALAEGLREGGLKF